MNNDTHIELLKQYQAGTISDSDRHVLERAALDDPFLFEAMEGYGVYGSIADHKALKDLSQPKKSDTGKVRWLTARFIGVAASLVALIAVTFLLKNQLNSGATNDHTSIASNDKTSKSEPMTHVLANSKDVDQEMILESQPSENEEAEDDYVEHEEKKIEENTNAPISANETSAGAPAPARPSDANLENGKRNKLDKKKVVKEESVATTVEAEITENNIDVIPPQADISTTDDSRNDNRASSRKAKPESDAITYADTDGKANYILGKVFDSDGNTLVGANVYIENTEVGTVTDFEGNFKLPKYEKGHQMVINYTGFQSQKIILGDIDTYQVVMFASENPLSEIVVSRPKEVDKNKAFPSMGMEDFDLYVSKNKEYPLEVFGTTKSGTFKVSSNVNPDGTLSNFTDESENCDECFKEAKRLLLGSGKWETKPVGQLYRTSYLFEF